MYSINRTYRFVALLMALLVFVASVGYTVDLHFCGGTLKSFSLLGKAKSCHELAAATSLKDCPHHETRVGQKPPCSMGKKGCCENKTLHFQSDLVQKVQNSNFVVNKPLQHLIAAFTTELFIDAVVNKDYSISTQYLSPLIPWDIYVLNQSFLL